MNGLHAPIEKFSLVEHIAIQIEEAILNGSLPLGSKLLEKPLAQTLGVSRGPLREAIRSLEGRRLVERIPNYGPKVIDLSVVDIIQIYDIRESLEGLACKLATERMSDAKLKKLKTIVQQNIGQDEEPKVYVGTERDFHSLIIAGAENPRLERIMHQELYHLLQLYRRRSANAAGRDKVAPIEHLAIVDAMIRRDASAAERLMREHICKGRENVLNMANL